jgi:hypothetical protein
MKQSSFTFKKASGIIFLFFTMALTIIINTGISAQTTGDYRSNAATMTWSTAGSWQRYNGTTWVTATAAPSSSDGVITIQNGHTVTVTANVTVDQLIINSGGILNIGTTTDNGVWSITVADGSGIDLVNNGTLNINSKNTSHYRFMTVNGQMQNNTNTSIIAGHTAGYLTVNGSIIFTGETYLSGVGAFNLSAGATIEISSANGIVTASTTSGNLRNSGTRTLNVGANYTYNGTGNQNMGSGFPTNLTGNLTINNPGNTVTLDNAKSIANAGNIYLTAGTFAAGTNLTMASTSVINRAEGSMTGTIQGTGAYNVNYTGNNKSTGPELSGSGLNNITLNLTSGQTLILNANTAPDGDVTTTAGTFDLGTNTLNRSAAGGTFTIAGTLRLAGTTGGQTGSNFPTNFSTINTTGGTIVYTKTNGGQTVYTNLGYNNLILENTSGTQTTTSDLTVYGTLTTTAGGTLDLVLYRLIGPPTGITNNGIIQTQNTGTTPIPSGKTWGGTVIFNGSTSQSIPQSTFNNVTLNNSNGCSLLNNVSINGTLTFSNGKITTSTYALTLGSSASVSGAGTGKYIYGNLKWNILTGNPTKTFYIGDNSYYTPVDIAFTGVTTGGDLTGTSIAGDNGSISSSDILPAKSVNRYWTFTNNGISPTNYDITLNYDIADNDAGTTPADYLLGKLDGSTWTYPTISGTPTSTSISATGLSGFSSFQAGQGAYAPVCTGDPSNQNVCLGSPASFTGIANAHPQPTSSWEYNDGTNGWQTLTISSPYSVSDSWDNGTNTLTSTLSISATSNGMNNYQYRVKFTNNKGNCTTNAATLTVNSLPATPTGELATPASICSGGSSTISATVGSGGDQVKWYTGSCGGTLVGTGDQSVSPTSTTTYYARSYNSTTGCYSTACANVTVTVNALPGTPTGELATPASICSGGSSTISATVGSGGDQVKWYTGSCGGTLVGTGDQSVSPNSTTTYYAQSYNSTTGCYSTACANVTVTVNALPATPTGELATPASICSGGSSTISATVGSGGDQVKWYTGSCGGTLVGTGDQSVSPTSTTTYYARSYNSTTGCYSTACVSVTVTVTPAGTWLGVTDSDWNTASNWCGGVPIATTDVNIPSGVTNMPHVTSALASPAVCNNLTIENGDSLTIDAGKALTVNGNLTVNGAKALIVKASPSANGSLITLGNITYQSSGSIKIEKYMNSGTVSHWEYFSSPVAAASSSIFTSPARGLWWVNEANNAWVSIPNSAPANMTILKGYGRNYVTSEGDGNVVKNVVGSVNTGSQSISLTRTESAPGGRHGWNFVGNPYPDAVDWEAVSGWTKTNINNAIYFRNDGTTTAYVDGVYTGNVSASRIIPPMRAFWVRVDSLQTSGSIACNNNVRVHDLTPPSITHKNTLHISVVNDANSLTDDAYVRFKDYATDGFDGQYDANKFYSTDATRPQIFTRIAGADDIAINTMDTLNGSRTIPLGFKTTVAGTFTITADMVSTLTAYGNSVYLKDNTSTTVQNLANNNTYQFTSGVTNGFGRFELLFNPPATVYPAITLVNNSLIVPGGSTSANLAYSGTTNNPDRYNIDFDAAANLAGFTDITTAMDVLFPSSPIAITIPSGVSPGTYHANLSVRISNSGAVSINYPITIEVQTAFTTSQDIGTTLQLSWTATTGATSYAAYYRLPNNTWIGNSVSTNSIKLINLTPETIYECKVISYKNGYFYSESQIDSFTTVKVDYIKTQDIGTTLQISWNSFPWASSNTFQYKKISAANWISTSAAAGQVKLSNLTPDTTYVCRLIVYKNSVLWGTTQTGTFTTGKVVFTTSNVTTTSVQLSWTSFSPWVSSYALQYRTQIGPGNWIGTPAYSSTSLIKNLTSATTYECRVIVYQNSYLWGTSQIGTFTTASKKEAESTGTNKSVINVYPNPFIDQISMDIFAAEETKVTWNIYDITGKVVLNKTESITSGYTTLNISAGDLPSGVYMLNAMLNDQMYNFRILKQ